MIIVSRIFLANFLIKSEFMHCILSSLLRGLGPGGKQGSFGKRQERMPLFAFKELLRCNFEGCFDSY